MRQHGHFQNRCTTQIVQKCYMVRARRHESGQFLDNHAHGRFGVREIDLLHPGLAMDAEAKFGLTHGNAVFLGRAGDGACVQRHADGFRASDHPGGGGSDLVKARALLGQGSGNLVDE